MSMKKIFMICSLIVVFSGCAPNNKKNNQESNKSNSENSVDLETQLVDDSTEVKVLNYNEKGDVKEKTMKIFLTKEEENSVRTVERKLNRRLFENSEYAYEYRTESLEDFQHYTSAALKALHEVLKLYGYKAPDEATFLRKLKETWYFKQDEVYKSPDFMTFFVNPKSVDDDHTCLENDYQASIKYRVVLWYGFSVFNVFSFEKQVTSRDTFGVEYTRYDENSDIVVDIDKVKHDIYANLYLFNDSKVAKTWLLANDFEFFNKINCFEDREVNEKKLKAYLNKVPDFYDDYYNNYDNALSAVYIWTGQDMMNLVFEKTDSAIVAYEADKRRSLDTKAFDLLFMYIEKCRDYEDFYTDPDFIKSACDFARMEISLNKKHALKDKNGYFNMESTSLSYRLLNDKILAFAKKENYFNIESFDEVLKVIEWDKKHDPQGSNDYHPFDYTTLLKK